MTKRSHEELVAVVTGFCDLTWDAMSEIVYWLMRQQGQKPTTRLRQWTLISFVSRRWRTAFLAWITNEKELTSLLSVYRMTDSISATLSNSAVLARNMAALELATFNERYFKHLGLEEWRSGVLSALAVSAGNGIFVWDKNVSHLIRKHTYCLTLHGYQRDAREHLAALLDLYRFIDCSCSWPGGVVKAATMTTQFGWLYTYTTPSKATRDERLIVLDRSQNPIYLEGLTSVRDTLTLTPKQTTYELEMIPKPYGKLLRDQHLLRGAKLVDQLKSNMLRMDALAQRLATYERACACASTNAQAYK